jgi:hypothetical protein
MSNDGHGDCKTSVVSVRRSMNCSTRIFVAALATVLGSGMSPFEAISAPRDGVVSQQTTPPKQRTPREKPEASQEAKTEAEPAGGPMAVFSAIERGWRANDVDAILAHFGKSKVSISIEGTGPSGGKFSKSQSYYLLKDLFKYTITKKFEFVQYRKPNENGRTSFAVAERFYQKTDDGRLFKDKIYVSLHTEDGETWVVNEIKSIR